MKSTNAESVRATESENVPTETDDVSPVEVRGRERIVVSGTDDFPRVTRTCTVECASGEHATDAWTGVPISALVEAADFSGETTHLRFEADDFAADVAVKNALDGILAFERRDDAGNLPRLVGDAIPGECFVKHVRRISGVALDGDEDPLVG